MTKEPRFDLGQRLPVDKTTLPDDSGGNPRDEDDDAGDARGAALAVLSVDTTPATLHPRPQ